MARKDDMARRLSAAIVASLLTVSAAPATARDDAESWEKDGSRVKDFAVRDLEGRTLRLASLQGKVVVVDFWATWCAPCLKELPDLAQYHERLEGNKNVVLLSFDVTDDRETLRDFVRENRLRYPVYLADDLAERYEIDAYPTKLIIDARGAGRPVIRYRRTGYTPVESIEAKVHEVLAGRPPVERTGGDAGDRRP